LYMKTSSLRTLKIMLSNLNKIVRSWIRLWELGGEIDMYRDKNIRPDRRKIQLDTQFSVKGSLEYVSYLTKRYVISQLEWQNFIKKHVTNVFQ
jgi:hypothetical protein